MTVNGMSEFKYKFFKSIDYSPHPYQQQYHECAARFRVVVAGRRFGKSAMAARDKLPSLFDPRNPVRGWIVGPTYTLGEKEFRYMWDDIVIKKGLGPKIKRKAYNVRSGEMYIELPWGSRVDVKSADHPDGLVGEGLDWVIMSEAAKLGPNIWDKYIRPALADRHGTGDFVTTPEGYNHIYELYMRGQKATEPQWASFKFPSWFNPYVYPGGREDPEILEMERNNHEAWFLQEIGADFTAFAGQIYGEFDPAIHVKEHTYVPEMESVLAVDFGFTNPFVALDIQVTPSETVHVWREYYKTGDSVYNHAQFLKNREQPSGFHIDYGVCDPADPGGKKTLEDEGITRFYPTLDSPSDKTPGKSNSMVLKDITLGINEVKNLLIPENPRLFIDPSCEQFIWEIQNYRTKESLVNKNENQKEEPKKFADHGCDCFRYFVVQRFVLGAGYHLQSDMYTQWHEKEGSLVHAGASEYDEGGMFTWSPGKFNRPF